MQYVSCKPAEILQEIRAVSDEFVRCYDNALWLGLIAH